MLTSAPAQLGVVPWAARGWSVTAWGQEVTPLSALGAFHALLWGFCPSQAQQMGPRQQFPGFVQSSVLTVPFAPLQCYLYLFYSSARRVKTFVLLFCICSCNIYLYGLRNLWQISFHIGVASLSSYQILTRQLLEKQPDCGVWKKNTTNKLGGLLLCFYNSFFYIHLAKNSSECFLTIHGNGYCKENSSKQG